MSDLQCAARLLLARHGEAEYESDILFDAGGSLTLRGRGQAKALAGRVRAARVAMVYTSDLSRAVQTAEIVAAELEVPVRVRSGLREFRVGRYAGQRATPELFAQMLDRAVGGDLEDGVPGGETRRETVARIRAELEAIVDLHRGETVLVVGHNGAIGCAIPHLATNLPDDFGRGRTLANGEIVELEADADGWVVRTWGGEPVRS